MKIRMQKCGSLMTMTDENQYRVPRFQHYAFDPDLRGTDGFSEVTDDIDADDVFSEGFQIRKIRGGYKKPLPYVARTPFATREFLLKVFPKLQTCPKQRVRAGRWARIITLFYLNNWSEVEVAQEMGLTSNAVKMILRKLRKRLKTDPIRGTIEG